MKVFNLPDLGEGLPDAEIVEWHVKEGEKIEVDAPLVSMETAKAVVEVPSPYAGTIVKLHGEPKDIIKTGAPLVEFVQEGSEQTRQDTGTVAGKIETSDRIIKQVAATSSGIKILPRVRALAKKMGVDLTNITPTGENNTITMDDVKNAANSGTNNNHPLQENPIKSSIDPSYEKLTGVRRQMAIAMEKSHKQVVPVTIFDEVNISKWINNQDSDLTVRVIQAIISACQKEPALNAWYDGSMQARKLISQVNLGLAADTQDGLFVPVIDNSQELSSDQLREKINYIKSALKARSLDPKQLSGASIVLSNFGKFAGKFANPIVVPPSVAILAVGRSYMASVIEDNTVKLGVNLPLSLTFDHRAVTGGEATRFLGAVMEALLDPASSAG